MEKTKLLDFDSSVDESYELNVSSGCDTTDVLDTSNEGYMFECVPKKLDFSDENMDDSAEFCKEHLSLNANMNNNNSSSNNNNLHVGKVLSGGIHSPPYKRVRALRLFDTPTTPKTLVEKCSGFHSPMRLKQYNFTETRARTITCPRVLFHSRSNNSTPRGDTNKPTANLNPFTPTGILLATKKRARSAANLASTPEGDTGHTELADESDCEVEQPTKRLALHDSNISRYHQEFHELGLIGSGEFGSVYKCINRLDGCIYAIKKSLKPVAGSANEKTSLNEVYAHAVLGKHQHVVRYYSAWAEDDHMIIQNEYCNGGSLAEAIEKNKQNAVLPSETDVRQFLLQISEGLRYIHSLNLVHMDIKPGNIFISQENSLSSVKFDQNDDGFGEGEEHEGIIYKIGDMGHVTSLANPQVEEGDCRYLPFEVMNDDFRNLTKADIFAFGLTVYEFCGGGPLPKNGQEWQDIRNGLLKQLPIQTYSRDLFDLIKQMVHPDPEIRPSAECILQHRYLCPFGTKSKAQLSRELNAEKMKNEILSKKLQEAAKCLKSLTPTLLQVTAETSEVKRTFSKTNRLIGKKVNRSNSTTTF